MCGLATAIKSFVLCMLPAEDQVLPDTGLATILSRLTLGAAARRARCLPSWTSHTMCRQGSLAEPRLSTAPGLHDAALHMLHTTTPHFAQAV